jgi:hypothetical protein
LDAFHFPFYFPFSVFYFSIENEMVKKCLIPFLEVSELDVQPEVGFTRHELGAILSTPRVNRHM